MSSIKITDLPEGRYRDVLLEAEKRGSECLKKPGVYDSTAILFAGLADIIAEMRENDAKAISLAQCTGPNPIFRDRDTFGGPLHG